ncbi:MAG: response regulator [Phaeospirillum sp.]|nr:response regulator [Phaeospirillum sp.]
MLYSDVRVLVIDDKPHSRGTTVRLLRTMGIRKIAEAGDGASGLEAYATLWPHVVVCDPDMKPVDGIVFLQTMMAEKKYLARIAPVIFLTADATERHVTQAHRFGAAGYLLKPVSMRSLQRQIDSALAQSGDVYGESTHAVIATARLAPVGHSAGV